MRTELEGYVLVEKYGNGGYLEVPNFMGRRFLEKAPEVRTPAGKSEIHKHEATPAELEALNRI